MAITAQQIQDALQGVLDPNTGKDLVTSRSVKNIKVTGSDVSLDVELGYPAKSQIEGIRSAVIAAGNSGSRPMARCTASSNLDGCAVSTQTVRVASDISRKGCSAANTEVAE